MFDWIRKTGSSAARKEAPYAEPLEAAAPGEASPKVGEEERERRKNEVRKQIRFYGRVQGVGFRYKAVYAARDLGLTGWVRNEDDGTVLMEVQGEEPLIGRLLTQLENDRYIRVTDTDIRRMPLNYEERSFRETGYGY